MNAYIQGATTDTCIPLFKWKNACTLITYTLFLFLMSGCGNDRKVIIPHSTLQLELSMQRLQNVEARLQQAKVPESQEDALQWYAAFFVSDAYENLLLLHKSNRMQSDQSRRIFPGFVVKPYADRFELSAANGKSIDLDKGFGMIYLDRSHDGSHEIVDSPGMPRGVWMVHPDEDRYIYCDIERQWILVHEDLAQRDTLSFEFAEQPRRVANNWKDLISIMQLQHAECTAGGATEKFAEAYLSVLRDFDTPVTFARLRIPDSLRNAMAGIYCVYSDEPTPVRRLSRNGIVLIGIHSKILTIRADSNVTAISVRMAEEPIQI